jgi:hypothetical protein
MAGVDEQLAALTTMSSARLRHEWQRLTGGPVPKVSPAMLRLALAWEIQAKAYGGLSRSTQQKLDQIGRAKTQTSAAQPGMRLVREWNGRTHVVLVGDDKVIRWNEREWRSLSEVARAITGTRWSGPAFFGLKKRLAA